MTLLEQARAEFEALFDAVILGPKANYVAGGDTAYVAVTCGGVRLVGEPTSYGSSTSEDKAVANWLHHAKSYATLRPGKILYWRCEPQLEPVAAFKRIYSRLFISDRKFSEDELSA